MTATAPHRQSARSADVLALLATTLLLGLAGCGTATTAAGGSSTTPTARLASDLPSAQSSPRPNPSKSIGATQAPGIPETALLTSTDVQPTFTGVDGRSQVPYAGNPFTGPCGPDGEPGGQQPIAAIGVEFTRHAVPQPLLGGESVIRFGPNGAHLTIEAINQLTSGPCIGKYQVLNNTLGGSESILVQSTDPETVSTQALHGVALYYAIIREGDYLVWLTLIDQAHEAAQTELASTLAQRGSQRLCTVILC